MNMGSLKSVPIKSVSTVSPAAKRMWSSDQIDFASMYHFLSLYHCHFALNEDLSLIGHRAPEGNTLTM